MKVNRIMPQSTRFRSLSLTLGCLMGTLWGLSVVQAAEITDVADAFDELILGKEKRPDPFDLYIGTRLEYQRSSGTITREPINLPGIDTNCGANNLTECVPLDELDWTENRLQLRVNVEIGLFQDLALTLELPIILTQNQAFQYAEGVNASTSTVDRQTGNPDETLFPSDYSSKHAGLEPLRLGFRWAPLNDLRDSTKPSWLISVTWDIPFTSTVYDPSTDQGVETKAVGHGVHYITFATALSKRVANLGLIGIDPNLFRLGYLDPYVQLAYRLPIPDKGIAPGPIQQRAADRFAASPSHIAEVLAGFEVVAYEDLKLQERFSIDMAMDATFYSEGRNYSLLTDPLAELTYTGQYLEIGAKLAFIGQPSEYVKLTAGFSLGTRSSYLLTNENVGEDTNRDGQVSPDNDLMNPYFCGNDVNDLCQSNNSQDSYDQVGFRFISEDYLYWSTFFSLIITL